MTILSVVGARPQFIKAAPLSAGLASAGFTERLIHTGQHYDPAMSDAFFAELAMAPPWRNLGVGSGSHAQQTATMLQGLETAILDARPDLVLLFGDTNSTLAGALAASKRGVPIAHVEAGLRSGNRAMPEEINRVVTDRLSTLLFCPSDDAVSNLAREGIRDNVHCVGDLMIEPLRTVAAEDAAVDATLRAYGVTRGSYALVTVHRAANTDDPSQLAKLIDILEAVALPIIFPLHPRTRSRLAAQPDLTARLEAVSQCRLVDPLGYGDTIRLLSASRALLTDSGGMQKEAYWLGVPCITLRAETEWVETVSAGWNRLTGLHRDAVVEALTCPPPALRPALYEQAVPASTAIVQVIAAFLENRG